MTPKAKQLKGQHDSNPDLTPKPIFLTTVNNILYSLPPIHKYQPLSLPNAVRRPSFLILFLTQQTIDNVKMCRWGGGGGDAAG